MTKPPFFFTAGFSTVSLIFFCMIWTMGTKPSVARAYCRLTTDSDLPGECVDTGIPLYWKCSNIEYAVCPRERDDLSFDDVVDAIEDSFQSWEDVECDGKPLGFAFMREDDPEDCDLHDRFKEDPELDFSPDENLILFVKDWEDFGYDPYAFALTAVWYNPDTGLIPGADMELNDTIDDTIGDFGVCGVSSKKCQDLVDIQNVVTHEIGHVLGLGHTEVADAVMFDKSDKGDTKMRVLKDDDIEGICAVYLDDPVSYCSKAQSDRTTCACVAAGGRAEERGVGIKVILPFLAVLALIIRISRRAVTSSSRGYYSSN